MPDWKVVERHPQAFGDERKRREEELDKEYPEGWQEGTIEEFYQNNRVIIAKNTENRETEEEGK